MSLLLLIVSALVTTLPLVALSAGDTQQRPVRI
jgi:hypothetical protein